MTQNQSWHFVPRTSIGGPSVFAQSKGLNF
jgi:hypothetical protein